MTQVSTSSGKHFEIVDGESLLDAALRADVGLSYSCRTGRCGTCRGRVRRGETTPLHHELGLSEVERTMGWILTCVRSAQADVELEIDDLGDVRLSPPRTLPCRIHSLERLSDDVVKVLLRLPPTSNFEFHCGQYIDVIGQAGLRRSYSIAGAPTADKHLELHIRRVPGGSMSDYWFERARANDLLRLHGPLGTFFLRETDGLDLVFLATGTGIAPVKAILEGMGQRTEPQAARSVSVFWGGRVQADLYWDARSTGISHHYIPVLSRADASWKGARGHVQQAALAQIRDWAHTAVYACGSEAMIHDARRQLTEAGLVESRFLSDAFVCSSAAA